MGMDDGEAPNTSETKKSEQPAPATTSKKAPYRFDKPQLKKTEVLPPKNVTPQKKSNKIEIPALKKVAPGDAPVSPRNQRKRIPSVSEQSPSTVKALEKEKKKILVEEAVITPSSVAKVEACDEAAKPSTLSAKPVVEKKELQPSITKKENKAPQNEDEEEIDEEVISED